jgi:hypothetical protein
VHRANSGRHTLRLLWFLLFAGASSLADAQNIYLPLNDHAYHTLDRLAILSDAWEPMHGAIKPYRRGDVAQRAYRALSTPTGSHMHGELVHILLDNNEFGYTDSLSSVGPLAPDVPVSEPFLGIFYRTPAHLFEIDETDFYLRVNPLLDFAIGSEQDDDNLLFNNQRGIELRGGVDQKVFFAANIIETQLRPSSYVRRWVEQYDAVPDAGLYKNFSSSIFNTENGYDYLNSSGYLGFNISRHFGVQLGHGKNFIGDGYRSLLLSDFSKNYFFLKLNTRVWRLHYQNIFAELTASTTKDSEGVFPKKYMAAHYLSLVPTPNFSIGLFESVIFSREETGFELQYLNPFILYRSIEHHVGSPDNVLIGLNARWDVANRISLYGQLLFDELKVKELFSSRKWWGNKNAYQLGIKYINVGGVDKLDLQLEYNRARPYTYSHRSSDQSYTHFHQPLAHPAGANFNEIIAILRYMPIPKLELSARLFLIDTAEDSDSLYYGTNLLRPNTERTADFGIEQGQGIAVDNAILHMQVHYMLKHNLYLEARYFRRNFDSADDTRDLVSQYVSLGIRWNMYRRAAEF